MARGIDAVTASEPMGTAPVSMVLKSRTAKTAKGREPSCDVDERVERAPLLAGRGQARTGAAAGGRTLHRLRRGDRDQSEDETTGGAVR